MQPQKLTNEIFCIIFKLPESPQDLVCLARVARVSRPGCLSSAQRPHVVVAAGWDRAVRGFAIPGPLPTLVLPTGVDDTETAIFVHVAFLFI